jgi:hypothetical protein
MTYLHISLLVAAILVIAGLAFYAGKLFAKLRKQKTNIEQTALAQQAAIEQHNKKLVDSIRLIAKAVSEQQCELSEGAIRICRLLEKFYVAHDANFPTQYPALHELDGFLADYPTHKGYKALKRQERMRFDVKRIQHEERLKLNIEQECLTLKTFSASTFVS